MENFSFRKKWQLFAGISNYTQNSKGELTTTGMRKGYYQLYDQNTNRPLPGITGVDVKNKGSMGSTREATINFTCWDLNQLNAMELLYMT